MAELINIIAGVGIILLNLVPFIFNKPKYLVLTSLISLMITLSLVFFK